MPHIVIEHTANLGRMVDIDTVVSALHDAAVSSGYFPVGGCRTLARSITPHLVGDRAADNVFVHITIQILPGRDRETKRAILHRLEGVATDCFRDLLDHGAIGLMVELSEFDGEFTIQRNNLLPATAFGFHQRKAPR